MILLNPIAKFNPVSFVYLELSILLLWETLNFGALPPPTGMILVHKQQMGSSYFKSIVNYMLNTVFSEKSHISS